MHDLHVWSLTPGGCWGRRAGKLWRTSLLLMWGAGAPHGNGPVGTLWFLMCADPVCRRCLPASAGIPLLCAHINLSPEADPTAVLHEVRG